MKGEPGPESLWARGTTSESRSSRLSCPPASPCCLAIGFAHLDPLDLHGGIWVNRKGAAPGGGWRRWMVIHVLPFMQECTQLGWPISQLLRIRLFPTTVAPSSCTAAVVEQGDGCARSVIAAAFFPSSMHTHKGHGCDSRRKPLPTHCHRHSIPLGLWLSLSLSLTYTYTHTHTRTARRDPFAGVVVSTTTLRELTKHASHSALGRAWVEQSSAMGRLALETTTSC